MSIEEIIERLDKMAQHHEICGQIFAPDFPREKYKVWGQTLREAISLLRTHQDNQPNEPKGDGWVSVDDKLPVGFDGVSICQNVIAYTVEGEVCPGWLNGGTWHLLCGDDDRHTKHGFGYVTHWRPLPDPPKEEV